MANSIEEDRRIFFSNILNRNKSLEELISYYFNYHGVVFKDQRKIFAEKIAKLFQEKGIVIEESIVLDRAGSLKQEFMLKHFHFLENSMLSPCGNDGLQKVEILTASENDLKDVTFPKSISLRSHLNFRPQFCALSSNGGSLFMSPNGYSYFDSARNLYYPAASYRSYSRAIEAYPRVDLNGLVVLVQDSGDGSNFAHFSFDWLTRIMYAIECNIIDKKKCTFVMGGKKTPYHELMINQLCNLYKLNKDMFFFPTIKCVNEIKEGLLFFSDQQITPSHPAQVAHPTSIEMLKKLMSHIKKPNYKKVNNIFISRADAKLRKIANEDDLAAVARGYGFEIVELSKLKIDEQIGLVGSAKRVIGAHGMGFSHLVANSDGHASVLELFHPTIGTDAYALISRRLGLSYNYLIGTDRMDGFGSYEIDQKSFDESLNALG